MKNIIRIEFEEMSEVEQGMVLLSEGRHLTQILQKDRLINLYALNDFFIEVFYSLITNQIEKIEVVTDLSRIDLYIDANLKEEKLHLN